ncbi:MAG: hypothetical protein WC506_06495 [Candidatus Micrarchaeia archaeon]
MCGRRIDRRQANGLPDFAKTAFMALFALLPIVILAAPAVHAQSYSSGGTLGLTIVATCGANASIHFFNVTNGSIGTYYDFYFILNNTGNVPVSVNANSFTNQGADPLFQVLASNYAPASCANPLSNWTSVPNSSASPLQVCDVFNYTTFHDLLLINGSYYVSSSLFSPDGTNNTKNESLRLSGGFTGGNQTCTYNETITLFFTGAYGGETGNFTLVLDNNVTTVMFVAGDPLNLTVLNATSGSYVRVIEDNSWLPLALPQYTQSNVSNEAVGIVSAVNGTFPSFTIVPTGGSVFIDPKIGNYSARVELLSSTGSVLATIYLNITNRDLASDSVAATMRKSPANRANIQAENNFIYRLYDAYMTYGGGPTYNVTILSDNTSTGFPSSVRAAMPIALNLTARYANNSPIANATIEIMEKNGYISWAMNQFTDSNVTNYGYAYTRTDSNGNVQFVITPTGGVIGQEAKIGPYTLVMVGKYPGGSQFFSKEFNVTNRDYTITPSYNGGTLPNRANLDAAILYVFRAYDRLNAWLVYGT